MRGRPVSWGARVLVLLVLLGVLVGFVGFATCGCAGESDVAQPSVRGVSEREAEVQMPKRSRARAGEGGAEATDSAIESVDPISAPDLELSKLGRLRCRVMDHDGTPVAGVNVQLLERRDPPDAAGQGGPFSTVNAATTDADGNVELRVVSPGGARCGASARRANRPGCGDRRLPD